MTEVTGGATWRQDGEGGRRGWRGGVARKKGCKLEASGIKSAANFLFVNILCHF